MVVERGQRATRRSVDALAKDEQVEATGLVADREDWGVVAVPPKPKSKPRALPHSLPHTQMAGSVIVATMLASILIPIGVFLVAVMGRISDLSPYWWGLIVVAGLFCLLPLARWLLFRRRLRNLVNYGAIVEGEVIDVAQDSVSGLYRVYCQACPPGSSTPIKFISGSHRYDPARHHRDFSAIRLPVYLDPERPVWRYFVDDSEMCDQWTPAPGWRGVAPRQYPVMPKIRTATTPKPTIRTSELDFAYSAA
ncbi:MAG: hypothetical protein LBE83_08965, partial [Propionibacteriaceae bacterium]|nr:hypothetical protein [Propionibacteriaceae bacterium]